MAVTRFSENCHTREFLTIPWWLNKCHLFTVWAFITWYVWGNKTSSSGNFIEAVTLCWLPSWIRLSIEIKLEFNFISKFLLTNKYNLAASRPSMTIKDLNTHIMTPTQEQVIPSPFSSLYLIHLMENFVRSIFQPPRRRWKPSTPML